MTINERLFKIMEEKKLKQADLANFLNIRTSVIGNWKTRGTTPPAELLIPICEFLEISIYELLDAKTKSDITSIYIRLSPEDKSIVDIIFNKYKEQESSATMIG